MENIVQNPSDIAGAVQPFMNLITIIAVIVIAALFRGKFRPALAAANGQRSRSGTGVSLIPAAAPHIHGAAHRLQRGMNQVFHGRDASPAVGNRLNGGGRMVR